MNPFSIIHKYYDPASELYRILVTHSVLVTKKALDIAVYFQARNPQKEIDLAFKMEKWGPQTAARFEELCRLLLPAKN
jgi:hypothetical protein